MTAKELQIKRLESGEIENFFDCLTDILMKYSSRKSN